MSETAPETVAPEVDGPAVADDSAEQPDTGQPEEKPAKDWESEAAKWRTMSRQHEKTAKANAEAARRLAEIEDAQKSEADRQAERLAAAERRAVEAETARARLLAAAAYNVPAGLLDRLGGSTEDEINEAAQAISEEINAAVEAEVAKRLAATPAPVAPAPEPARPSRTRPVESLTPGGMPATDEAGVDGNAFLRRMAGRT